MSKLDILLVFLIIVAIVFFLLNFIKKCPDPEIRTIIVEDRTPLIDKQYSPNNKAGVVYQSLFDQPDIIASGYNVIVTPPKSSTNTVSVTPLNTSTTTFKI